MTQPNACIIQSSLFLYYQLLLILYFPLRASLIAKSSPSLTFLVFLSKHQKRTSAAAGSTTHHVDPGAKQSIYLRENERNLWNMVIRNIRTFFGAFWISKQQNTAEFVKLVMLWRLERTFFKSPLTSLNTSTMSLRRTLFAMNQNVQNICYT